MTLLAELTVTALLVPLAITPPGITPLAVMEPEAVVAAAPPVAVVETSPAATTTVVAPAGTTVVVSEGAPPALPTDSVSLATTTTITTTTTTTADTTAIAPPLASATGRCRPTSATSCAGFAARTRVSRWSEK